MAGIYIHIPFCKKACHYCDFHFSTTFEKYRTDLLNSISKELELRKNEAKEEIETIYFGGGTPSLLSSDEIDFILGTIFKYYPVVEIPEITLEANPDDLTKQKLQGLATTKINRLSIGIQSFDDKILTQLNRAHSSEQALESVTMAQEFGFKNITIDLIYGIPNLNDEDWRQQIKTATNLNVSHISAYSLTVEEKTALHHKITIGEFPKLSEEQSKSQFEILMNELETDFEHYEISNFGKEGFHSKHNSSYWKGKQYIGVGPSAHSFNGCVRSWNIRNNTKYIDAISKEILPSEKEKLTEIDLYNERVMIGLRTMWGIDQTQIGNEFLDHFTKAVQPFIDQKLVVEKNRNYVLTKEGKFLADHISSELFFVE